MRFFRVDASIICFALVVVAAIPVATLRSRTYSIGYDLGNLKQAEKTQRQRNTELKSAIARTQRNIRDQYLNNRSPQKDNGALLELPTQDRIMSSGNMR